ncbi:MAG TPA: RNA 2',3'-cyclic phosphodiesterase [Candidatus Hydrogenedentes bacterium]|nr:RNA 2',3'-cyclic phosphodiesterase [Candidatus Hydrogenedentota bacterium]HIJ73029.1 RNA 2',3'-cyclic phosphodiesterase [Candidatus Hydrogenedentota bacterium]
MRTFIAIELPEPIRRELAALGAALRQSGVRASWVTADRIHLTLRFLGEIDPEDADHLSEILTQHYAGHESFRLRVAGVGAFPNLKRPSVVWVGVGPSEGGLSSAHAIAETAAQTIGLAPEKKRFNAHLTLARVREARDIAPLVELITRHSGFCGGEFDVTGVALFSSKLTPNGPVYKRLKDFLFR